MNKRESIPATTCDYMIRMNLKCIESISRYMVGGCDDGGLNGPQNMCVALIDLKRHIDIVLERYSK